MYTIVIADIANSSSDDLKQVQVESGSTVGQALAQAGVTLYPGQKVALNGVNTTLESPINVTGMLSVTGEAKAAQ